MRSNDAGNQGRRPGWCRLALMAVLSLAGLSAQESAPTTRPGAATAARLSIARALFASGDRAGAKREFDRVCAGADAPAEAWAILGMICLEPPFADPARAGECIERALALDPHDLYANFAQGARWNAAGENAAALPYLERAVAMAPTYQDAWFQLGRALFQLAWLGRADDAFVQAPNLTASTEYRALIASRGERFEDAARFMDDLLARFPAAPDRGKWLYQSASFLTMVAGGSAARARYEAALAAGFERAEALNEVGLRLYESGDADAAHAFFGRAAAAPSIHAPRPATAAWAAARFQLGLIDYNRGRFQEAREQLLIAVQLDRFHENAWFKLGQCQNKLGAKAEAAVAFERHKSIQPLAVAARSGRRSLDIDPEDHKTRFELARVLSALGRSDEALEHLVILEARSPNWPDLTKHLIEAAEAAARPELAAKYRRRLEAEDRR